jgi:hypothetical protein
VLPSGRVCLLQNKERTRKMDPSHALLTWWVGPRARPASSCIAYKYGAWSPPCRHLNLGREGKKKISTSSYSNSSPVVPLPLYLFVCLPPAPQLIKRSHFDYCYNKGGRSRRLAGRPSFFEREGFGQRLLLPKIRIHFAAGFIILPALHMQPSYLWNK